jgi:septal ring factor EnvC (AmiA/AmiB activator)
MILAGAVFISMVPFCMAQSDGFREQVTRPVETSITLRQNTQTQEAQWREDQQALTARFDQLTAEKRQLRDRHDGLQRDIQAARARIAEKERQLKEIRAINEHIEPFLRDITARLQSRVDAGLPFLPRERRQRIRRLSDLLDDSDVMVSEKYRKTMEALLVEAEYGNTIEVYQQTIALEGRTLLVNVFRLGCLSLFYQTLDHKQCGFFDRAAAAWQPLHAAHNRAIGLAMEIGAKRKPVELLNLPLGRIVVQ